MENENKTEEKVSYLYEIKKSLVTSTERSFLTAIKHILPEDYYLQPQVCLRSVIERTDEAYYQNELYKIIDVVIFERKSFKPVLLVEINDETHNQPKRIERDKKVKMICEEAGLPLVTFWTKFGVNENYIQKRILEGIEESKNPVRVAHSKNNEETKSTTQSNNGCYIATCVYGSYDCPQVWTLRRFRDFKLSKSFLGRTFIRVYYAVSPKLVRLLGNRKWFVRLWKKYLDNMIQNLQAQGYDNTPYYDR